MDMHYENSSIIDERLYIAFGYVDGITPKGKKEVERRQAILELLTENPTMTQAQLMEQMGLTKKQVQKDVKELQEEGLFKREGSNRNGSWVVVVEKK